MEKNTTPTWLAILVAAAVLIGNWYVHRLDRTDFNEVVAEYTSKEIELKKKLERYGFVIYQGHDERQRMGVFEKQDDEWAYLGSSKLYEKDWGFFSKGEAWYYFGIVKDPQVSHVLIGAEKVPLLNEGGDLQFFVYREPNGYNYPIKAVKEDGSVDLIKAQ